MKRAIVLALLTIPLVSFAQRSTSSLTDIQNVIIIYQENWSFDALYGFFPEANGLANAGKAAKQADRDGKPYATLPQVLDSHEKPPAVDRRFPADLPVAPF